MTDPVTHSKIQSDYFTRADADHFRWMTGNPYFSLHEKELLTLLNEWRAARVLEIGCGEGGNLVNLGYRPAFAVGVDLFLDRCRFARAHADGARTVCANGLALPIREGTFDLVFCRDLLHHVLEREALVRGMARACRPGGRVACIEACGRNPVILTLAAAVRAERGLLRSNARALAALLERAGLIDVAARMYQPLPIYRILLHPKFGLPSLAERAAYRRWADRLDRLFARIVPRALWGYTVVSGRKPGPEA